MLQHQMRYLKCVALGSCHLQRVEPRALGGIQYQIEVAVDDNYFL